MRRLVRDPLMSLKTPSRPFEGRACFSCRQTLPTTEVWHIVGPWSPEFLQNAAEKGEINKCDCPNCGTPGYFAVPLWICMPNRSRNIVLTSGIPIPLWTVFEKELIGLRREQSGFLEAWLNLPSQHITDQSYIHEALEIPDDMVWLDESADKNRVARLGLLPRIRSKILVEQVVAQVQKQHEEHKSRNSGILTSGEQYELGLLVKYTQDELTRAGQRAILREIERQIPLLSGDAFTSKSLETLENQIKNNKPMEFHRTKRHRRSGYKLTIKKSSAFSHIKSILHRTHFLRSNFRFRFW